MFINKQIQQKVDLLINNNSLPLLLTNKELYSTTTNSNPIKIKNRTKVENFIKNTFKPQVTIILQTTDTNTPLLNCFKAFLEDRLSEVNNGRFNSLFYFQSTTQYEDQIKINLYIYNCALINFDKVYLIDYLTQTTNFEIPFTEIKNSFREAVEISTALLAFYRPQHLVYKDHDSFRVQLNKNNFKFIPFPKLNSCSLKLNPYKFFERPFHYMPNGQFNPNINQWLVEFNSYYGLNLKINTNATPEKLKAYSQKVKEIEELRKSLKTKDSSILE